MTQWWVRHGQSTWNVVDRMQGHELSPPLTELGRRQAVAAAGVLADLGAGQVLTSPAARAVETAEIIAARLGTTVEVEPRLLEKGLDEPTSSVLSRITDLLDLGLPAGIVLVSHGDTIALAVGLLSGTPPALPGNAQITSVDSDTRVVTITSPVVDPTRPPP